MRQSSEVLWRTLGAVYRCRKDNGWNIEFVSEAIEEITGYPSSVFLGKGISAYRDIIHADDQAMIRNTILEAFFSGRGFVAEYQDKALDRALQVGL